jgi:DNA-binding NarL/FixJ family response regulator
MNDPEQPLWVTSNRKTLTVRETQVALAIATGRSNSGIAAALEISKKTVDCHVNAIYRKLGLHSTTIGKRDFRVLATLLILGLPHVSG